MGGWVSEVCDAGMEHMGKLGFWVLTKQLYVRDLCYCPVPDQRFMYAPILIAISSSTSLRSARLTYLESGYGKDSFKVIGSGLWRKSLGIQGQSKAVCCGMRWGNTSLPPQLFIQILKVNIYCKRWDDWYLRFLFPTLLASKGDPDHTSRW